MSRPTGKHKDEIELYRGGYVVSSLLGALGSSLKETRLTALLGYLISLNPEPFIKRFNFKGKPITVKLECLYDKDRADIVIATTEGLGLIEAKINATDPFQQVGKYDADWKVLLTQYVPSNQERRQAGVQYICWDDLAELVENLRDVDLRNRFVENDFLKFLE